jgi:tRNA (guanine-N7-)-methyltransferase
MNAAIPDLRPWFVALRDHARGAARDLVEPFDWKIFWGNDRPVELEVGSGRGLFLLNSALAHPEVNWLGVEIEFKEGRYAARRLQKRSLPNARILGGDARDLIDRFVVDGSVQAVHVYFPDPWWKRRHHKRRLFNLDFVQQAARILPAEGRLHLWTDVGEYFSLACGIVAESELFDAPERPPERPPQNDLDYLTNFERKKRQAGETIRRAVWRRNRKPSPAVRRTERWPLPGRVRREAVPGE